MSWPRLFRAKLDYLTSILCNYNIGISILGNVSVLELSTLLFFCNGYFQYYYTHKTSGFNARNNICEIHENCRQY
jgi:hypothetical protein